MQRLLRHIVTRHRRSRVARALANRCRELVDAYENLNYDTHSNGEQALLRRLQAAAGGELDTVFDVGAHTGGWALSAGAALPRATLHLFEVAPALAARLRTRLDGDDRYVVNGFGLADEDGEVDLFVDPGNSELTTLVDYRREKLTEMARGRVRTGDGYLDERGIARVGLLKVDAEGAEHRVLRGFGRAFASGRIDVVQFEYGQVNIVTHFLLRDFYRFFTEHGFRVGKLYPEGVAFRDYELRHEDFRGPNYVAVRRERDDVVAALTR